MKDNIIDFVKVEQKGKTKLEVLILENDWFNLDSSVRHIQSDSIFFNDDEVENRINEYKHSLSLILANEDTRLQLANNLQDMEDFIDENEHLKGDHVRHCHCTDLYTLGALGIVVSLVQFEYTRYVRAIQYLAT